MKKFDLMNSGTLELGLLYKPRYKHGTCFLFLKGCVITVETVVSLIIGQYICPYMRQRGRVVRVLDLKSGENFNRDCQLKYNFFSVKNKAVLVTYQYLSINKI